MIQRHFQKVTGERFDHLTLMLLTFSNLENNSLQIYAVISNIFIQTMEWKTEDFYRNTFQNMFISVI